MTFWHEPDLFSFSMSLYNNHFKEIQIKTIQNPYVLESILISTSPFFVVYSFSIWLRPHPIMQHVIPAWTT